MSDVFVLFVVSLSLRLREIRQLVTRQVYQPSMLRTKILTTLSHWKLKKFMTFPPIFPYNYRYSSELNTDLINTL